MQVTIDSDLDELSRMANVLRTDLKNLKSNLGFKITELRANIGKTAEELVNVWKDPVEEAVLTHLGNIKTVVLKSIDDDFENGGFNELYSTVDSLVSTAFTANEKKVQLKCAEVDLSKIPKRRGTGEYGYTQNTDWRLTYQGGSGQPYTKYEIMEDNPDYASKEAEINTLKGELDPMITEINRLLTIISQCEFQKTIDIERTIPEEPEKPEEPEVPEEEPEDTEPTETPDDSTEQKMSIEDFEAYLREHLGPSNTIIIYDKDGNEHTLMRGGEGKYVVDGGTTEIRKYDLEGLYENYTLTPPENNNPTPENTNTEPENNNPAPESNNEEPDNSTPDPDNNTSGKGKYVLISDLVPEGRLYDKDIGRTYYQIECDLGDGSQDYLFPDEETYNTVIRARNNYALLAAAANSGDTITVEIDGKRVELYYDDSYPNLSEELSSYHIHFVQENGYSSS